MALSRAVYVIVLTCMDFVDSVYAVVAAVHGVATGLYWITYSDALLQYSTDDTRDICINFVGIFSGFISLVLPLFSGYLLDVFSDLTGYYILFGACGVMALLAVWLVTRLESEEIDHKKTQFLHVMKKVYTEKMWFFAIHMDFWRGIRDGAFSFFLNVLLFSIVSSEALVGVNTFLGRRGFDGLQRYCRKNCPSAQPNAPDDRRRGAASRCDSPAVLAAQSLYRPAVIGSQLLLSAYLSIIP